MTLKDLKPGQQFEDQRGRRLMVVHINSPMRMMMGLDKSVVPLVYMDGVLTFDLESAEITKIIKVGHHDKG